MNFLLLFFNLYPKQTNWRIFAKNISSECIYVKARNGILNMKSEKEIGRYCHKNKAKIPKPNIYKKPWFCLMRWKQNTKPTFCHLFNVDIMFNPKNRVIENHEKVFNQLQLLSKELKNNFHFFHSTSHCGFKVRFSNFIHKPKKLEHSMKYYEDLMKVSWKSPWRDRND